VGGSGAGGGGEGGAAGSEGCEDFVMPSDCTVPDGAVLPGELRCTGLYGSREGRELACGVLEYKPAYELWSDAAVKRRFVWLPPGERVDVTDPNEFEYPVGTKFWKEFRIPAEDGLVLGETRLMQRVDLGWLYTAYVWSEDGAEAVQENDGVPDLHGTGHTVPSREQCKDCHSGRQDFILGWDAIMLGEGASGVTREDLVSRDMITWMDRDAGAPSPLELQIPGDATERPALGYLHANRGVSCHNDNASALAEQSGLFMRIEADALDSVLEMPVWITGYNREPSPNAPLSTLEVPAGGNYVDLRPLDLERSLIYVRMQYRNDDAAMPAFGTNRVDPDGMALIEAWILAMTPERGYPQP
jgi:hypothetical protein